MGTTPLSDRVLAAVALAEASGVPAALRRAAQARAALAEAHRLRDELYGRRPHARALARALKLANDAARLGQQPALPW